MKLFYMILASLITVLMASYALWLIAHVDMPLPKRLVQLFPPLFLLIMVFLRISGFSSDKEDKMSSISINNWRIQWAA